MRDCATPPTTRGKRALAGAAQLGDGIASGRRLAGSEHVSLELSGGVVVGDAGFEAQLCQCS